jgi:hypothetical protein
MTDDVEITNLQYDYANLVKSIISKRQQMEEYLDTHPISSFRAEVRIELEEKIELLAQEANCIMSLLDSLTERKASWLNNLISSLRS